MAKSAWDQLSPKAILIKFSEASPEPAETYPISAPKLIKMEISFVCYEDLQVTF